jgi:hypothetical protein
MQAEHAKLLNAANPMAMPDCMARLDTTSRDMNSAFTAGRARGMITHVEEVMYLNDAVARHRDWVQKFQGGVTINECRDHLNLLETQALGVRRMVGSH